MIPAQYILGIGGKRVRPVMCLMGNELVDAITPDAYHVATAIELFHNFTLTHRRHYGQGSITSWHANSTYKIQ